MESEQLPGQMSILDFIEDEPEEFEDYIGKCKYFARWVRGCHYQSRTRKKVR